MSIHYEVQFLPDPGNDGYTGIYHVVRMDGDTVLKVVKPFFGAGRYEAYVLAGTLNTELAEWRSEQQRGAIEIFQKLSLSEFKCLRLARDLPHEGVYPPGIKRGPGSTEFVVLETLENSGLLVHHPEKPLHWVLSPKGKLLMGIGEPE